MTDVEIQWDDKNTNYNIYYVRSFMNIVSLIVAQLNPS